MQVIYTCENYHFVMEMFFLLSITIYINLRWTYGHLE